MSRTACNSLLIISFVITFGCGNQRGNKVQETSQPGDTTEGRYPPDIAKVPDSPSEYPATKIANSHVRRLHSSINNFDYDIYVGYPANFQKHGTKYPTLYVLDAEVNFGAVYYIVQRLSKDGLIPAILVVGVAYPGDFDEDAYYSLRCRDLTPTVDNKFMDTHKDLTGGSGGASQFAAFLSQDLFPFIEQNYSASNERTLYGHSLGGLFGFYSILNHPDLFSNYLLLSPSLWWDNKQVFRNNQSFKLKNKLKVYVATGELEDSKDSSTEASILDDQIEIVKILRQENPSGLALKDEILSNETHRTIFDRGVTNGLRFIFSKK